MRATVGLVALAATVALGGCGQGEQAQPAPVPSPAPVTATPESALPSPAPAESSAAAESASETPATPAREPQRRAPGVPDPTAAGPLDAGSLPNPVLGFRGVATEPAEGEFNPNGTWVHAVDASVAGFEAWPRCGGDATQAPTPQYALAGTYRDGSDTAGNGLVLRFGDAGAARSWFSGYGNELERCPKQGPAMTSVQELKRGETHLVDRRVDSNGQNWSEFVRVRDTTVQLVILGGDQSLADMEKAATS